MRRMRHLRVLGKETGRLLSLRALVITAAIAFVFFFIFMEYYSEFTHSHSLYEEYEIAQKMLCEYGTELDIDEFDDFMTWKEEYEAECERQIIGNPIFESVGVYSYADYEELYHQGHAAGITDEENHAMWALLGEQCDYARFYVQAHEEITSSYELALSIASDSDLLLPKEDARKLSRETQLYETGEYESIFPSAINNYTEQYLAYLAVLCVLSAMFIAAPAAVTDSITGVDSIQRTTRHGRFTAVTRFGGAMAASLTVVAAEILMATVILLTRSDCGMFWNSRMDSFMSGGLCFGPTTFGQHYIGSVLMILALSVAAALLSCVMSSVSRSMVSVILKLVPVFVVFIFVCNIAVMDRGMFANALYRLTRIPCAPLLCALLLLTAAITACVVYFRKELKADR